MYKYQLLQIYAKLMSVMEILQRNLKIPMFSSMELRRGTLMSLMVSE